MPTPRSITIALPRLAGMRASVQTLLQDQPVALEDTSIIVTTEDSVSIAQSFADELVRELLVQRNASHLTVHSTNERLNRYLSRAAELREVTPRFTILS